MKTHELFAELLERSGMNPNALATALGGLVKQPQLHKFKNKAVGEPRRTTMGPVADYYGVPLDAFYVEAVAEKILADIASGAFVVKANRRGPVWTPQARGSGDPTLPTASAAPTLAQAPALTIEALLAQLGDLLMKSDTGTRAAVADLLVRYAQNPAEGERLAQAIKVLMEGDKKP